MIAVDWSNEVVIMSSQRNSKNAKSGKSPQAKPKTGIAKPGKLDIAKAGKAAERVIRENQTWLEEMAKR